MPQKEQNDLDGPHNDNDLSEDLQEQLKIDEEMSKEPEWSEHDEGQNDFESDQDEAAMNKNTGWPEE